MNRRTFNKDSWHYKLASITLSRWDLDSTDICEYSRAVFWGILLMAILACVAAAAWYFLSHAILGIVFGLIYGFWILTEQAIGTMLILALAGIAAGGTFGIIRYNDWRNDRKHSERHIHKPDNFVKQAYHSWKDKFCFRINFVDENGAIVDDEVRDY